MPLIFLRIDYRCVDNIYHAKLSQKFIEDKCPKTSTNLPSDEKELKNGSISQLNNQLFKQLINQSVRTDTQSLPRKTDFDNKLRTRLRLGDCYRIDSARAPRASFCFRFGVAIQPALTT